MRHLIFVLAVLTIVGNSFASDTADAAAVDPIRIVTAEPGILPPGTSLIVRMKEKVRTAKASRSTVYMATTAVEVLDQQGAVLIPRDSPVELVVSSVSYLGPGGAGMTVLTLDIDAVVVRDIRYPVETTHEKPGAGGIGVNRGAAKWIGGSEDAALHVVTRGQRIDVPMGILLGFQIQAPLRLQGYQRQ